MTSMAAMTGPRIADQEFVVHLFAPLEGPHAVECERWIRTLWRGLQRRLGPAEAIPGTHLPTDLPAAFDATGYAIAAFEEPGARVQAIIRREHDVLNLSCAFTSTDGSRKVRREDGERPPFPRGWAEFDRWWDELAGDVPDPLLGVARLYLAKVPSRGGGESRPSAELARAIRPSLPFATDDSDWWHDAYRPRDQLTLWEPSAQDDERIERRIVVVAPDDQDPQLSAWTWSRGDTRTPPLARYLLHAAKTRYLLRVYDDGRRVRELHERTDRSTRDLAAPEERLTRLRTDEAELLDVIRRLEIMRQTVGIAAANMAEVLGEDGADRLFADDKALATWFGEQLKDDLAILEAARSHTRRLRETLSDDPRLRPAPATRSPQTASFGGGSAVVRDGGGASGVDVRRKVFVVHGRDETVRERMFDFLRALNLWPLDWELLVAATGSTAPFLGDVVQRAPADAQAAVVLMTPDDIVRLHPDLHGEREPGHETGPSGQARPNVLIELGMVLMAYPERTIIVHFGDLRPIADLAGRNYIRFDGSSAAAGKLVERLKLAGCAVVDQGGDWRNPARFADLDVYGREPTSGDPV
ncbi:CATRA conflict system CASPASE/TPR repeat-associated protein [Actinomadura sp. 9N215]|uniref:CATRA conflict system CASPASE/TPR repeat-associated protein n=1 Tax=Actinomadura sp. 9N215 TaxID=3375150 RepID=UPI0037928E71